MSLSRIVLRTIRNGSLKFNRLCNEACLQLHSKTCIHEIREFSGKNDKPIAYSHSPASKWKARSSFSGTDKERPWYEAPVILFSLGVFMIYFCVLREESDIDNELRQNLYSRIDGLEENQLIISLNYNRQHGLNTKEIEDRLNKIRERKH